MGLNFALKAIKCDTGHNCLFKLRFPHLYNESGLVEIVSHLLKSILFVGTLSYISQPPGSQGGHIFPNGL